MTILFKKKLKGCRLTNLSVLMFFGAFLISNSGCFYVPLPSHNISPGAAVIPDKLLKSLKPEENTREDLLLLLGEPDERGPKDRYFIYYWTAIEGTVLIGVAGGGNMDINITHYICIEFEDNNRIKRLDHFETSIWDTDLMKVEHKKNDWISEIGK